MIEPMPTITSFVIRFVHSEASGETLPYRGTIRHIPSHQEIRFVRWSEAEAFMRRFVPLESGRPSGKMDSPPRTDAPM